MPVKSQVEKLLARADVKVNGDRPWDIQIKDERFFARVLSHGSLGLGESYMDGWWDAKCLDQFFFKVLSAQLDKAVIPPTFFLKVIQSRLLNLQSKRRSHKVAEVHYNFGNDFYEKMLDTRMLYTCAYWKDAKTLDKAQEAKLDLICKKIQLKKTDTVLDIGCGWGSFSKYAAEKYGCRVIAVNISEEQVAYARKSCKGLPVEILLSDYRDVKGTFNKVVAIGICEHIGYKNYRTLMEVAHRSLKKDGIFLLHTIGSNTTHTASDPWFDKYIFPHGVLPSMVQLTNAWEGLFVMEDVHSFGPDYDKTLMAWFANIDKNWPAELGERMHRMWKYYLLSCAGSFRARNNQLWQVVLSKNGLPNYTSVR